MRSLKVAIFLLVGILPLHQAAAMFMWYQTEQVPIARIFTNLQQRLAQNTNDFEATYYLARLHSMAYSTNLARIGVRTNDNLPEFYHPGSDAGVPRSVQVFGSPEARKQGFSHLTNAIQLYERAIFLLKRSTNTEEKVWMVLPTQLGLAWCLDQAGRTNDALATYRKALKDAWHMEVTGDFSFKKWVGDVWSDVRAQRNPLRSHNRGYIGPGVCFSEEIIGYLLRLLDPTRDASEIAQLKKDQATLRTMGRAITPLLIPVISDTRFEELVDRNASVTFDLDGSGRKRRWGWLTPKAGWLVYDPNQTGRVDSALQMFGDVTFWLFWPDGYQALSALDDNGDGVLSGPELRGLAVWNDRNCDGISDPGEVVPVEALGIESLSCASQTDASGLHWNPRGATFTNGISRASYDWVALSRAGNGAGE
jgi:hypothetical protein